MFSYMKTSRGEIAVGIRGQLLSNAAMRAIVVNGRPIFTDIQRDVIATPHALQLGTALRLIVVHVRIFITAD